MGQKSKPLMEKFLTQVLMFNVESSWTGDTPQLDGDNGMTME